jgi:purine-binding chemotaxis protein CheW
MVDKEIARVTNQYLTFALEKGIYAIDVGNVREILEMVPITKIPRTPEFMRGVINNRGSVVPVIDMRLKFEMGVTEKGVNTCIIVTEIALGGEPLVLGILTDSVQEVIQLEPQQIEPAPKLGTGINSEFIKGIGKKENVFILILDVDKLFSGDELAFIQQTGENVASPVVSAAQ